MLRKLERNYGQRLLTPTLRRTTIYRTLKTCFLLSQHLSKYVSYAPSDITYCNSWPPPSRVKGKTCMPAGRTCTLHLRQFSNQNKVKAIWTTIKKYTLGRDAGQKARPCRSPSIWIGHLGTLMAPPNNPGPLAISGSGRREY